MKKLILIFLFITAAHITHAQGIKVKIIDVDGIEKWVPYVPGITTVTGITKIQLDSTNAALRDYIQKSLVNYQTWANNQFAVKGTTGSAAAIPNTIALPEQTFLNIITPASYGQTYSDGTRMDRFYHNGYSTFNGVNSRSNRPDVVYLIAGYNVHANNGRVNSLDGAWDISVETHFDIPTFTNPAFEFHTQRIKTTSGKEVRGLSWYVDKVTGGGFHNFVSNSINVFNPGYENADPYFKTFDGRIELRNNTLNNSGTGLFMINDNGQTIELHQRGGVPVFNIPTNTAMGANYSLHFDSWNGLRLVQGFYNNNADAKAANLKTGDTYWTRLNGIKVLAQVE